MAEYDIAVVGGGINGAGVARDAAGRGLKVLLVEQNDLAAGTSSASTKLAHGGLRYLEQQAFDLVRASLAERETLLRSAPHIVHPMRFVLPVQEGGRPAWFIRLGLLIYDLFAWRGSLPLARRVNLNRDIAGNCLRRRDEVAFEYSDCTVDDARLVILNAVDAAERGAVIRVHTRCARAERSHEWTLVLDARGRRSVATARVLVNTTGPWTAQFSHQVLHASQKAPVRLVKGSHIVVPKMFGHGRAYLFQNRDGRVIFAIPFHRDFTLIGTTDSDYAGDPGAVAATPADVAYLCDAVNGYFAKPISAADVVWAFAGIRSLYDDGREKAQEVSRDHVLQVDAADGKAALVSLYGGKLTTYRRVAEEVLDRVADFLTLGPAWTASVPLPGGDIGKRPFEDFAAEIRGRWPFLEPAHAERLAAAYGTRVSRLLGQAQRYGDLGPDLGAGLTGAEVRYLMRHEWAETSDDVLWRRTKLGLRFLPEQREALTRFMAGATGAA